MWGDEEEEEDDDNVGESKEQGNTEEEVSNKQFFNYLIPVIYFFLISLNFIIQFCIFNFLYSIFL